MTAQDAATVPSASTSTLGSIVSMNSASAVPTAAENLSASAVPTAIGESSETLSSPSSFSPREQLLLTLNAEEQESCIKAAEIIAQRSGSAEHDLLVVLGSGLAQALDSWGNPQAKFALSELPGVCAPIAAGHLNEARSYLIGGMRVLVYLGRTHLYEGHGVKPVIAPVQAAIAAGVKTAVLTNANGCLADWSLGDVMTITDHVNFTGVSPFSDAGFVDTTQLWDSQLSALLQERTQRSGVYAILRGPEYQTRAETRILRAAGVDAVGMSTVMEALTLHRAGVRVCGMSVVSDLSFSKEQTTAQAVVEAGARGAKTVAAALDLLLS